MKSFVGLVTKPRLHLCTDHRGSALRTSVSRYYLSSLSPRNNIHVVFNGVLRFVLVPWRQPQALSDTNFNKVLAGDCYMMFEISTAAKIQARGFDASAGN